MKPSRFPVRALMLKDASMFETAVVLLLYASVLGALAKAVKTRAS